MKLWSKVALGVVGTAAVVGGGALWLATGGTATPLIAAGIASAAGAVASKPDNLLKGLRKMPNQKAIVDGFKKGAPECAKKMAERRWKLNKLEN